MQVPMERRDPAAGTVVWRDPDSGEAFETTVTGGAAKLQWKADWAMRWYALGVDYEMSGKDLIDSVRLSGRICRILGGQPPDGFTYELFLDEQAQKISKSKGNGLSVEEWLRYAPPEIAGAVHVQPAAAGQAALFRRDPARGGRVHRQRRRLAAQPDEERPANPAWHIHAGRLPQPRPAARCPSPCCSTWPAW